MTGLALLQFTPLSVFPEVKRLVLESNPSAFTWAGFKNTWRFASISPYTPVTCFIVPIDGFCSCIPDGGVCLPDYTVPLLFIYLFICLFVSVAGAFDYGNELSGSIKCGEFLE